MLTFAIALGHVITYAGLVTVGTFLGFPLTPGIILLLLDFYCPTWKELSFRYNDGELSLRELFNMFLVATVCFSFFFLKICKFFY